MGLFSNLLKKGADKMAESLKKSVTEAATAASRGDWEVVRTNGKDVWQKLEEAFSTYFADYEMRHDVPAAEIGGDANCRSYTYGLYLNGELKLLVMVTAHNKDKSREYRCSKEQAQKAGVPFLNFFSHFENREEYIKERLGQYLKYSA